MSKKKNILTQTGITEDKRPVISGLFKMYDTYGLPLDVTLFLFKERGLVPDLYSFYQDAIKAGWSKERILHNFEHPIIDVYGRDYYNEVIERINLCMTT